MRFGILGSGLMGAKLGTILARAGHEVVFNYAQSNDKLKKLARAAQGKARAGSPGEAAKEADAMKGKAGRSWRIVSSGSGGRASEPPQVRGVINMSKEPSAAEKMVGDFAPRLVETDGPRALW